MILLKPALLTVHARVIQILVSEEKKQSHERAFFRNNGSVSTNTKKVFDWFRSLP